MCTGSVAIYLSIHVQRLSSHELPSGTNKIIRIVVLLLIPKKYFQDQFFLFVNTATFNITHQRGFFFLSQWFSIPTLSPVRKYYLSK